MQRGLAEALLHHVRDPRLREVNLTRVRLTPDLRLATVYFLLISEDKGGREAALVGLEKATPFLRRHIASTMQLRYTPALRFFYDDEMDEARRIDSLLRSTGTPRDAEGDPEDSDV